MIKIWKDKWIPRRWDFKPFSPINTLDADTTVTALINQHDGWWNIPILKENFFQEDIKAIYSIPLGDLQTPDCKIWALHYSGKYSVRSGYNFIQELSLNTNIQINGIQPPLLRGAGTSTPREPNRE
ncbi:hypothetical protein AXF42_Ash008023 [Apostasia shenzhenica]|uniref:Uncharacterized protein n=1 Tax=Apostasia shenzhenica TaxID=1088818 RepID=A0A2I0A8E2_9ASPA|nr:hypothetical protein AXF42_Ash008023 [Apostasia shenzhenica]